MLSRIVLPLSSVAVLLLAPCAKAEFLYDSYIVPSFASDPDAEYSAWDVFYSPFDGINYPDFAAPNGTGSTASAAGFTPPANANPADPFAFWHGDNPSITQTDQPGAFIIGPGTPGSGNIYSFSGPTGFTLADDTPSDVETVVFQFQTEGTMVDFDSIRLVHDSGTGEVSLPPDEFIREYRSGSSSFGGLGNRNALQWNLAGLGIDQYEIRWKAAGSSMSLQEVALDTSPDSSSEVPEKRTWTTAGAQSWTDSANWLEGSPSIPNGRVLFTHPADATITLTTPRTVGELKIDRAADLTIENSAVLSSNTGIVTTPAATGTTRITGPYALGAFNFFDLAAGTVRLTAPVSGSYGLSKQGAGTLDLEADNTFTGGVGLAGGILRLAGTNAYTGSTNILLGDLVAAADAPSGAPGSLGDATSNIGIGAASIFAGITTPARLIIEGPHEIARNISFGNGGFDSRVGARQTQAGAHFSGNLGLAAGSTDVHLFAEQPDDLATFSGPISGGTAGGTLTINAEGASGTVRFTVTDKSHTNPTIVRGGALELAPGVTCSSPVTLSPDAASPVARLIGTGDAAGGITVASGGVLAPGQSIGTLTSGSQQWQSGGALELEIADAEGSPGGGWDLLAIDGGLDITSTAAEPFVIRLQSVNAAGTPGPASGFSPSQPASWSIASTTDEITGITPDRFLVDTSGFDHDLEGGSFSLVHGNGDGGDVLLLDFTPSDAPPPDSPLDTWLAASFSVDQLADPEISGLTADFDQDGLSTLLEYALGGDPLVADRAAIAPVAEILDNPFGDPGDRYLTLRFQRQTDHTDLEYRIVAGDSPDQMDTVIAHAIGSQPALGVNGGQVDVGPTVDNQQPITAADAVKISESSRRFMRLEVTRP